MRTLSEEDYLALKEGAEIKAEDHHGEKVLLLADGTYLKLFRVKRLITSARLVPYWRRFEKNAAGLKAREIPTLTVTELIKIPSMKRTAVRYEPLIGQTLREVAPLDQKLVIKLGRFMRDLHDRGVYLRSLHLGNVVLTPEGDLGLIDVADMRLHRRSLPKRLRLRNLKHLERYQQDRATIEPHLDAFVAAFAPDPKLAEQVKKVFT